MAHSPAAAEAYLQFNIALAQARLSRETRALITAAVAEANGCSYGHLIARGEAEGLALTAEDLDAARRAEAKDFRTEQALRFAQRIVRERGKVPPAEVAALRNAGFDNAEIVEIVASVALNMFRNYFSLVAGTVVESAASPA
jgi:alkylhydroperoxidase family enzyme